MMKISLLTGLVVAAVLSMPVAANDLAATAMGNPEKGKEKAGQICQACHGLDGNGVPGQPVWPKLAGQHPRYIYKQLTNFKAQERWNALMGPMAMPLTEEEMRNLAAYYATLPQAPGEAKPELVEQGEKLYRAGNPETGVPACSGCHGPAGLGNNQARYPRISGQWAEYIDQTLKYFRTAERANDPNGMMRGVANRLTDQEIAAVSAYVQGLRE